MVRRRCGMSDELRDLSSLPEDPAYWAALEQRVVAGISDPRRAHVPLIPTPWYAPLVRRVGGLAAVAAAAGVVFAFLPSREMPDATGSAAALRVVAESSAPPALAALIVASASPEAP